MCRRITRDKYAMLLVASCNHLRVLFIILIMVAASAAQVAAATYAAVSLNLYEGGVSIGHGEGMVEIDGSLPQLIDVGGYAVQVSITAHDDYCPGDPGCEIGASTRWEVTTLYEGPSTTADLLIGVATPSRICQCVPPLGYQKIQCCPTTTYVAKGNAWHSHVHQIEFLVGVPTQSEWGLGILALMLMLAGILTLRGVRRIPA